MSKTNIGEWAIKTSMDATAYSNGAAQMIRDGHRLQNEASGAFNRLHTIVTGRATAMAEGVRGAFSKLSSGNVFGVFTAFQGSLAASGATAAIGWIKGIADAWAEYIKSGLEAIRTNERFARTIGVSRDAAASMLAIGGAAGFAPEAMQDTALKALEHIGQLRTDLAGGGRGGEAGSALRLLGINPQDFATMSSFNEQLGLVGDRLNALTSAADRAAAGQAVFGRSWGNLQPLLRQGSEGLARMENYARQLGVTVSGEAADSITAAGTSMAELRAVQQMAADGLRNQYVASMHLAAAGTRDAAQATRELVEAQRHLRPMAGQIGTAQGTLSRWMDIIVGGQVSGLATAFNQFTGVQPEQPPAAAAGENWWSTMLGGIQSVLGPQAQQIGLSLQQQIAIDRVTDSL